MKKNKKHITVSQMYKQVRRELLLEEGKAHLPSNKTHTPKNAYKRKKFRQSDLRNLNTD